MKATNEQQNKETVNYVIEKKEYRALLSRLTCDDLIGYLKEVNDTEYFYLVNDNNPDDPLTDLTVVAKVLKRNPREGFVQNERLGKWLADNSFHTFPSLEWMASIEDEELTIYGMIFDGKGGGSVITNQAFPPVPLVGTETRPLDIGAEA